MAQRTSYEDTILSIWRDVLGRSDIDVSDDFFTFGDHSLVPIVVARIRESLGVAIPVMDFLEARTATALAAAIAARSAPPSTVPRRPADAEEVLSFDQQRIWMESQLLPDGVYNNHARRRLVGPLDVATVERSIRVIIARHESLRTRFPTVSDHPVPVVEDADDTWCIRVADLTGIDDDREGAALRLLEQDITTDFDLAEGPLFRVLLVKLSDTEHILGLTLHQIISDSRSIYAFNRELAALYRVGGDAAKADLPELSIQYRDFAVWQRNRLTGETLAKQVGYWRDHLAGAPPILALPAAQRRTATQGADSDRVECVLPRDETAALHDLCRAHDVTPFMALLAALTTVFCRWSGQTDIVTGVAFEGRADSEVDKLMGIFFNILPMRTDLSGNPTFAELLGRVRRVALDGFAHAEAPIDVVVRDLQVARDPRRTPLFEVVLNVTAPPQDEQFAGLTVESMGTSSPRTRFDLFINAQEYAGSLGMTFDFTASRFDAAMMRLVAEHLHTLLREVTADPTRRILDYSFRSTEDAARFLDRVAVIDANGRWTYRQLNHAADRVAEVLADRNVRHGDRVAVVNRPTAGFVAALLGCQQAGAVVDASQPGDGEIDLSALLHEQSDPVETDRGEAPAPPVREGDWAVDRFGLRGDDRFTVLSNVPGHLMSAVSSALHAGATLLVPDHSTTGDIGTLTTWLRDNAISVLYVTPPVLRAMAGQRPRPRLPALRCAFVDNSGELIPHDVDALRALSAGCRCVGVYRAGVDGTPRAVYEVPAGWHLETAPLRVPLGVELPDHPARLLRPSGQPAAAGEVGEICFGSYRTGDLGRRWADGWLEFVHRAGASATLDPIETVATLRDMPAVRDAVVIEHSGPDARTTLLGYVAGVGPAPDPVEIHNFLRARLPGYLIPERLVVLDDLPRTAGGEYDLTSLPDAGEECGTALGFVAPRTELERELADTVMELLDIDRVGVHDSFFELGGFSMLATKLTTRIRARCKVELALRDVFESPTVAGLAELIILAQAAQSGTDELEALLDEIESEPMDDGSRRLA